MSTTTQTRRFLDGNYKQEAAEAAFTLTALAQSPQAAYAFSCRMGQNDFDIARASGEARRLIALANNLNAAKFRAGSQDKDKANDFYGALGEWLVGKTFKKTGWTVAPLVEVVANKGVDLTDPDGFRFDVKTMPESLWQMRVNCEGHAKKKPQAYLFVKLASERIADFYVVSAAAVEKWTPRHGHSAYFACDLPRNALPLAIFEEEPEPAT